MIIDKNTQGIIFGFLAALLNGSVGTLSVFIFQQGSSPYLVSFYKCLIATLFLFCLVILNKRIEDFIIVLKKPFPILFCAFLGFFMLFFFETIAYSYSNISTVVFALFASSVLTTFVVNFFIKKKAVSKFEFLSALFSLIGILLFSVENKLTIDLGLIYATFAGIGYGLFMIFSTKLNIKPTLEHLTALLLFASLYLSIPFLYTHGFSFPVIESLPLIVLLALLPTIGGFFCTIKALSYIPSNSVVVIEISELIFASIFAFVFLFQKPSFIEVIGGFFIILSVFFSTNKFIIPSKNKRI